MKMILFSFTVLLSLEVWSEECELRKAYTFSQTICWNESLKAHISKNCLPGKCDALIIKEKKPSQKIPGSNRTADACTRAGADAIVLRDTQNNEESFCSFPDGSLRSAASVESAL